MPARHANAVGRIPSAMGLAARLASTHARAHGVAVRPLLRKAGLSSQELVDPRTRLPVSKQIHFLNLVAAALADDMLGLHLAVDLEPRRIGLYYYVLASSPTLLNILERAARFTSIVNDAVIHELIEGRRIGLSMRYSGVKRRDDRHQIEFWLASLMRICRLVTGKQLQPDRVRLTHQAPRGHLQFERYIGCKVEYGATRDEILFAREDGELGVVHADPFLNRLLVEVCEETLSRQRRPAGAFTARVENAVVPLLPHGTARAARIADDFGLSERTFARRLAEEGTTFTQLLDRLRLELARRYLINDGLAICKVAWLLGYREVGAFSHAFRRWTGQSPSEVARRG